jgi:hypothetical protein
MRIHLLLLELSFHFIFIFDFCHLINWETIIKGSLRLINEEADYIVLVMKSFSDILAALLTSGIVRKITGITFKIIWHNIVSHIKILRLCISFIFVVLTQWTLVVLVFLYSLLKSICHSKSAIACNFTLSSRILLCASKFEVMIRI